ncbi:hypothetical protein HMI55_002921 [Coelomomyces lativittatus]|nr:hypothetical protein HMI55_002921 [Coelomomyces lativittatus]
MNYYYYYFSDFTNPLLDFAPNLLAPCMEEATPTTPCMVINEQLQIPPLPLPSLDFSFLSTKKAPKKITKRKPWPRRRRSSVQRTVKAIDYNDITVLELKDLLKEVGTKVSGKKEALIHRLKSEFDL